MNIILQQKLHGLALIIISAIGFGQLEPEKLKEYYLKLQKESFLAQVGVAIRVWRNYHIEVPALVLSAWGDRNLPSSLACMMGKYLGCETKILPGLSHDMMLEPEWRCSAEEILIFLYKFSLL